MLDRAAGFNFDPPPAVVPLPAPPREGIELNPYPFPSPNPNLGTLGPPPPKLFVLVLSDPGPPPLLVANALTAPALMDLIPAPMLDVGVVGLEFEPKVPKASTTDFELAELIVRVLVLVLVVEGGGPCAPC